MPRLRRVLAVARRDLSIELGGRRGWLLPVIALGILLPAAAAPTMPDDPMKRGRIAVQGDVPPEVEALERIEVNPELALLDFEAPRPGKPFLIHGYFLPDEVRQTMDKLYPPIRTQVVEPDLVRLPDRSLFLSLVAASVLTGAISQSIPGERTHRTLETLLVAGISRMELVLGKFTAWAGFGAVASLLSAAVAILLGRQEGGWWVVPTPMVSAGTVALGLWLVRRANDVVGGATVALRVLPATLMAAGVLAWFIGGWYPLIGAAVPLGGALIAAGSFWPGPLPPLIATASTAVASGALLLATARDLDRPETAHERSHLGEIVVTVGLAALCWWGALLSPIIWIIGGNADLLSSLPVHAGVMAGSAGLGLLALVHAGRSTEPAETVGLTIPAGAGLAAAALGLLLAPEAAAAGVPLSDAAGQALVRLQASQGAAVGWGVAATAIVAQTLLLQGWLQRHAGPWVAGLATAALLGPHDPLRALAVAGLLTGATVLGRGSVAPALLARLAMVAGAALTVPTGQAVQAGIAVAAVGLLLGRRR